MSSRYPADKCFDEQTHNNFVYGSSVKALVLSALEGINGTVFMYG